MGSTPDEFIGFLQFTLPFQPHYGLGLTQSLIEINKVWPELKADNFIAICEPIAQRMWEL
jgi:hypothetical protein